MRRRKWFWQRKSFHYKEPRKVSKEWKPELLSKRRESAKNLRSSKSCNKKKKMSDIWVLCFYINIYTPLYTTLCL